jgi:RNA polymerase sigma-70 factor (ECF subfamily)
MDEASDRELVERIALGGVQARAAEAVLCRRFAPHIHLYGLRHLRDDERARELIQSVLLAVLEGARAGRIQDPDKLDRFVLGTCRNTVLRIRQLAQRSAPVSDEQLASLAQEPFEFADTGRLLRCMEHLDARAKQVLLLSFHEERSADEIAEKLAISAGNVRVVRHRALHALRRCLDRQEVPA